MDEVLAEAAALKVMGLVRFFPGALPAPAGPRRDPRLQGDHGGALGHMQGARFAGLWRWRGATRQLEPKCRQSGFRGAEGWRGGA